MALPLEQGDLEAARRAVAMLVGRDPQQLDACGVARACVESVGENLTDGILATLFWATAGLLLAGLPGAAALAACHRAANVLDALWGRLDETYRCFGTAAARLDDVLNWCPARLSLPCIVLAAALLPGLDAHACRRVGWRDRHAHESPNSAWSEAAFAGALGLRLEISQGCEADDCIASLAARFAAEHPVVIVSGDKDLKQCLGPNVYMWDPASKEEKLVSEADFTAESGVTPAQWPDVQALIGDTSDNIPGVPGIGPKTARQIFSICPSLEDIRDHFVLLPPKLQAKLQEHLENMFIWRELTTLRRDFCPGVMLDDLRVRPLDAATCALLTEEFELFALRRELAALDRLQAAEADLPEEFLDAGSIRGDAQPAAGKLSLIHISEPTRH